MLVIYRNILINEKPKINELEKIEFHSKTKNLGKNKYCKQILNMSAEELQNFEFENLELFDENLKPIYEEFNTLLDVKIKNYSNDTLLAACKIINDCEHDYTHLIDIILTLTKSQNFKCINFSNLLFCNATVQDPLSYIINLFVNLYIKFNLSTRAKQCTIS